MDLSTILVIISLIIIFLLLFKLKYVEKDSNEYWRGRSEGWFACENMVFSRIERHYPDTKEQLISDLLQ